MSLLMVLAVILESRIEQPDIHSPTPSVESVGTWRETLQPGSTGTTPRDTKFPGSQDTSLAIVPGWPVGQPSGSVKMAPV